MIDEMSFGEMSIVTGVYVFAMVSLHRFLKDVPTTCRV